jgi:hypothetical protein
MWDGSRQTGVIILRHLRHNVVAYLALAVALGTGTAYAAVHLPAGSVATPQLKKNAVTSSKIKNGTIKTKDLNKPAWVQSVTLSGDTPPAVPDVIDVAAYDFALPKTARTSVTVFIPTLGANCDNGSNARPTAGLYIDNVPIPTTAVNVAAINNDRSLQLTATLDLGVGVHAGRVGLTCPGPSRPNVGNAAGAKTWTLVQADS